MTRRLEAMSASQFVFIVLQVVSLTIGAYNLGYQQALLDAMRTPKELAHGR